MAQNFIPCDRDQQLLLAPNMREWLPEGHLAYFVIEAVGELDLADFYARYRPDGWGRAAYDPSMMLTLSLYAYAVGVRSSRQIERRCHEDVAFRVICAGQPPDHATIARFRAGHEEAIAALFTQVLSLCAAAGMGSVGQIAIDSTKLLANASRLKTRTYESIARQILEEANEIDAREDELYGEARGDELPPELRTREGRLAKLREAKARLEADKRARQAEQEAKEADRREREAAARARGRRPVGRPPKPSAERKSQPKALRINLTDPDSRLLPSPRGFIQGYCAQAAVSEDHLILAAEIAPEGRDDRQLAPMSAAAKAQIEAAGLKGRPETVLADAGYFNSAQIAALEREGLEVLVPTRSESARKRRAQERGELPLPPRPRPGSVGERMAIALADPETQRRYRRRGALVEPVFGDAKANRGCERLMRRGAAAARSEWRLIAATHNLLRLFRTLRAAGTPRLCAAAA
ncbi:MAG TPA: IS1182 family transposase [Solirubrobacterales bacterium]